MEGGAARYFSEGGGELTDPRKCFQDNGEVSLMRPFDPGPPPTYGSGSPPKIFKTPCVLGGNGYSGGLEIEVG